MLVRISPNIPGLARSLWVVLKRMRIWATPIIRFEQWITRVVWMLSSLRVKGDGGMPLPKNPVFTLNARSPNFANGFSRLQRVFGGVPLWLHTLTS
jgi:hypothetical protein